MSPHDATVTTARFPMKPRESTEGCMLQHELLIRRSRVRNPPGSYTYDTAPNDGAGDRAVSKRHARGKSLRFDRSFAGVGRITRSSGTRDRKLFAKLNQLLGDLFETGQLETLRQIRSGSLRAIVAYERFRGRPALRSAPLRIGPQKVYAILRPDTNEVKIGLAVDPNQRLIDLQVGSASKLVLLSTRVGGMKLERELHARFAQHRRSGEWFAAAPEVLAWAQETAS